MSETHETAVVVSEPVRYARPLITRQGLQEEAEQRKLLMEYVRNQMVEGTDFGVIPGSEKRQQKTLLKPGAEKLTDLFQCTPEFELTRAVEDWDKPLIHYVFRCRIVTRQSGQIVAEGFGSCNSRESKYRYRNGERLCPACGKATIIKGKAEYGGGWICFTKKSGCGAKFEERCSDIINQQVGRVENMDVADVANTILKMAKKRAQVDAVIALARCSDMFTQDVEDFDNSAPMTTSQGAGGPHPKQEQTPQNKPEPAWQPHPDDVDRLVNDPAAFAELFKKLDWNWAHFITTMNKEMKSNYQPTDKIGTFAPEHKAHLAAVMLIEKHTRGEVDGEILF